MFDALKLRLEDLKVSPDLCGFRLGRGEVSRAAFLKSVKSFCLLLSSSL
jgi:hypothetical protein